jgi:hypothetical protein
MSDSQESLHRISPSGFAVTLFIGSAVYLGLTNHGWQTLLTFKAVIFFLLGIVFSVLLIGVPIHLLRVWMMKRLIGTDESMVSPAKVKQVKLVTTILMVVQVVATFYITKFAYVLYFS